MSKTFRLTIEIDQSWIDDGFDFDDSAIAWLEQNLIPYAHAGEVVVRVEGGEKCPDIGVLDTNAGFAAAALSASQLMKGDAPNDCPVSR
jgi:hypothetical protein